MGMTWAGVIVYALLADRTRAIIANFPGKVRNVQYTFARLKKKLDNSDLIILMDTLMYR